MSTVEHPNTFRPNPATPLGRAYACMIEEMRGAIEHDEMVWLNANPVLWLRAIAMHRKLIKYRLDVKADQLQRLKPEPGDNPELVYLRARKDFRQWRVSQLRWLQLLDVRRQEVAASFGMESHGRLTTTSDLILTFVKIQEAVKHDDWKTIEDISTSWIDQLTEKREVTEIRPVPPKPEPKPAPVPADAMALFLSKMREGA